MTVDRYSCYSKHGPYMFDGYFYSESTCCSYDGYFYIYGVLLIDGYLYSREYSIYNYICGVDLEKRSWR